MENTIKEKSSPLPDTKNNIRCDELLSVDYERPHNWLKDFNSENGRYENQCQECNSLFIGHKLRITCKLCHFKNLMESKENNLESDIGSTDGNTLKMDDELDHPANLDIEGITKAVPYEYAIKFEVLLRELMTASAPYLKRKKETPRSQCTKLNEIHQKVRNFLK